MLVLLVYTYETYYHIFNISSSVGNIKSKEYFSMRQLCVPNGHCFFFRRFKYIYLFILNDVIHPHKRMGLFKRAANICDLHDVVCQHGCRWWSRGVNVKERKKTAQVPA